MKNYILLATFLVCSINIWAQWQIDTSFKINDNLRSINFKSAKFGFLISCDRYQSSWSSNGLYITTDSGKTWTASLGSEMCPPAAYFVNSNLGYFVTMGSGIGATGIWKITNGGNLWNKINYDFPSVQQKGIFFVDENTGWYAGGDGFTIYKTTNGGMSWTPQNTGTNNAVIDAIHFFNKDTGIIAGWYGSKIAKTNNGGNTWTDVSNDYGINSLQFPSATIGYAVGADVTNSPVIIKTKDAGDTWLVVYTSTFANKPFFFSSISCLDENICYAVGDTGTILKTTDGGASWQKEVSGTMKKLNAISCTPSRVCYIVGDSGVMLKNTMNAAIDKINKNKTTAIVYPNPIAYASIIELNQKINKASLYIFNLLGERVRAIDNINTSKIPINKEDLNSGFYFFSIIENNENICTGKLIIE